MYAIMTMYRTASQKKKKATESKDRDIYDHESY